MTLVVTLLVSPQSVCPNSLLEDWQTFLFHGKIHFKDQQVTGCNCWFLPSTLPKGVTIYYCLLLDSFPFILAPQAVPLDFKLARTSLVAPMR